MIAYLLFALCSLFFSVALSVFAMIVLKLSGGSMSGSGIHYQGLFLYSLVIGVGGALISLMLSKVIAKFSMGVRIVSEPQNIAERFLVDEISRMCVRIGIKVPEIGIFESDQINAFATGPSKNNSLVAVSTALLEQMSADEARAVLAHELGHVKNGDMVWMSIINGVANSIAMFGSLIFSRLIVGYIFDRSDSGAAVACRLIIELILQIALGCFAMIFVMSFSRYREYKADAFAAELVGQRSMVLALERLDLNRFTDESMPSSMKAFGISGGKRSLSSKAGIFSSHPTIQERVEALNGGSYA
ncbi:protease HtpX [Pseudomonas syringae pv. actinidiae]|nr:protease HtpX [Pseudomonas syringae pv. actinidiae]